MGMFVIIVCVLGLAVCATIFIVKLAIDLVRILLPIVVIAGVGLLIFAFVMGHIAIIGAVSWSVLGLFMALVLFSKNQERKIAENGLAYGYANRHARLQEAQERDANRSAQGWSQMPQSHYDFWAQRFRAYEAANGLPPGF